MGLFSGIGNNFKKSSHSTDQLLAPQGRVLAVINQKGGVGKTTVAFNTAFALAEQGYKVLCLDMDPQANLSLLFGVDTAEQNRPNIHQLLINSVRELKALHVPALCQDVIVPGEVDLLPAGQELSGFELTVGGISAPRQLLLKRFIEKNDLANIYDYIVIDCPPTLGLLVINVLCAAQGVLVPFRPDEFSRKGLEHFYQILEDIAEMEICEVPEVLAHIPNLVDMRRKQEEEDLGRIEASLEDSEHGARMLEPLYNRASLVKSQAQRKSVFHYQSKEFAELQEQFKQIAKIIRQWHTGKKGGGKAKSTAKSKTATKTVATQEQSYEVQ